MTERLEGMPAIVTGAGSGIGRATTLRFTAEGADVLAIDRDADSVAETARLAGNGPGRCVHVQSDVAEDASPADMVARCIAEFGSPRILVNNAGVGAAKPVHATEDADLDRFIDVNIRALFRYAKEGVKAMRAAGDGGCIINIASVFGIMGFPGSSIYSASKAAVIGLTRNMAADYGAHGIRVNAIAPGLIKTNLTKSRFEANDAFFLEGLIGQTPLGRAAEPEEVAAGIAFLCSADASFITGHTLAIDGGWSTTKFRPFPDDLHD